MSQSRNWCFTLFKFLLPLFSSLPDWANYLIFQEEELRYTKRKHIQGYVNLKRPQRFSFLKKKLPDGTYMALCRSSASSNRDYCTKDATRTAGPWEIILILKTWSNKRKTMENSIIDPEELRLADPKLYRRCLATRVNSEFSGLVLPVLDRPWQCVAQKILDQGPDDRTIIWVYGSEGNEGKTTWAKKKIGPRCFSTLLDIGENIHIPVCGAFGSMCYWTYPDKWKTTCNTLSWRKAEPTLFLFTDSNSLKSNFFSLLHVVVLSHFLPFGGLQFRCRGEIIKKPLLSRDRVFIININESVCGHSDDLQSFAMYLE
nr:alpha V1 [Tomato leaf curl Virudhunagar alphasatellite]